MKLTATPLRKRDYLTKEGENIEVVDVNFEILLEEDSMDIIPLCVGVDRQGKFINFPKIERLNSKNPHVFIELGRAINKILDLEGNQIKQYCEKLFETDNKHSLNEKKYVII